MQKVISRVTRIRVAYAISFTSMLFALALTWYNNTKLAQSAETVRHTLLVVSKLEELLSEVKDAETGYRGYLLSRDVAHLEPYHSSQDDINTVFTELSVLLSNDSAQLARLADVRKEADQKLVSIAVGLESFQSDITFSSERFLFKALMDVIRIKITEMKLAEFALLSERESEVDRFQRRTKDIILATLALSAILMFIGINRHTKDIKARNNADLLTDQYKQQLLHQIEELGEANKKLKAYTESEKMASIGRLARLMAHEVRNPLTNIGLATGELRDTYPGATEESELYFEMITRNTNRINELLTELLDSTKLAEISFAPVHLDQLLDEVIVLARDRAELYGVNIMRESAKSPLRIWVDAEKLKIALLNISINAIEAMSDTEGPRLEYRLQEKQDRVLLFIQDNGVGMDEETRSRLFEPFFTGKAKGTGLGLTNTQNIILNQKATIEVESQLGVGTTFIIGFSKKEHQGAGK